MPSVAKQDFDVVSLSVRSNAGVDPDVPANTFLKRYQFQPQKDEPDQLFLGAVPPEGVYDRCFVRVEDHIQFFRAQFMLKLGHQEVSLDCGVVRVESDPALGSTRKILTMKGEMQRMKEWKFVCRSPNFSASPKSPPAGSFLSPSTPAGPPKGNGALPDDSVD